MKDMLEGKSVKSYVYNTMEVVKDSMNMAASKEEFITILSEQGHSVDWQDKHKHMTFMDKDGNKVRDTNLNKTFNLGIGKEELLSKFEKMLHQLSVISIPMTSARALQQGSGSLNIWMPMQTWIRR